MTRENSENTVKRGPRSALFDLVAIVGALLVLKSLLLRSEAVWIYAGPISLLAALGVATWCLHRRGETWRSVGLTRPDSLWRAGLWTFVALIVTIAAGLLVEGAVASVIAPADEVTQATGARYQGRFADLLGNLPVYLFWLATAWIVGGFTEEMLFRGILLSRIERLCHGVPLAAVFAVAGQALLFGQQHYYYQGLQGLVATGVIGAVSGALYYAFGRNLWPLLLSHGISNSIGLTLMYLGMMG